MERRVSATNRMLAQPMTSSMNEFQREFDELARQFFENRWPSSMLKSLREDHFPQMNFIEDGDRYHIEVDIPGVEPKDIELSYRDGELTIRGERKAESESKDKNFHRMERAYGQFLRTVRIPDAIDEKKVTAEYKDGVLKVTLNKIETKKQERTKIEIKCK